MDTAETVVLAFAAAGFFTALAVAGWGASRAANRPPRRAVGPAQSMRALPAYLLLAVPYFALWLPLWRPVPVEPVLGLRVVLLVTGSIAAGAGLGMYLWGRLTLGTAYNVSSSLGTEVCEGHRLITGGPYRLVRHPMYVGLVLGAVGALLAFRTWTTVWALVAIPGAVLKARREDGLLAEEYGDQYETYAGTTSGWILRIPHRVVSRRVPTGGDQDLRP